MIDLFLKCSACDKLVSKYLIISSRKVNIIALNFASGPTSVSLEQLCKYELNKSHLIFGSSKSSLWAESTMGKMHFGLCCVQTLYSILSALPHL